ncbi:alpha/beta hydrolase [Azospirillum sp. YIM DDC1]|uniref:Alpha/beta hydrolase n=1 Tax=Azospirillum aestuarii TaxID=2802052 RepID=A0ABS1I837_9PROT|nr:alpha/beta hydrolase [Azospirillum aestuarii]MBK3777234.1 alpha/beta fold hydrolase [Azospirillum brasilense]MBK4723131.1 alpha/beta hydrolase [Azospirillum aestuarii]TWA85178.1 serine aminopeptidase S33 family [Azospirillum brasilense]
MITLLAVSAVVLLVVRAYDSQRGLPLEIWHTFVPKELHSEDLDTGGWTEYMKAEAAIFDSVRAEVTQKLPPGERIPVNRYFDGSPIYPGRFSQDWNRSYVLEPDGPVKGVVLFLHGLTDSPYSLRHIARLYQAYGFVAIAIRLPGHGTVPAGLADIVWEDWLAATRLAAREAQRRIAPDQPFHVVGFSNGGALAMMYALDAHDDTRLKRPDRIILISPMIGITAFARFAGLAGLPAIFPPFAKAAWLGVVPEFNPFKYNSFPVNGARQSHLLTSALQSRIANLAGNGRLDGLPPILTFQSVMDFTVSTRAILSGLYAHLPANGSELVLFDVNRNTKFGPLLSSASDTMLARILPDPPRRFRTTIITNADAERPDVVARMTEAGAETERVQELGLVYPPDVYSLSHVALPFPTTDSLYGLHPDPNEDFGIHLGAVAARGERGALIVSMDALLRMSSNPFFPYLLGRIEETLAHEASGETSGHLLPNDRSP